jgi:fructokinase
MANTDEARPPLLIGVGEVLWDCYDGGRRPGGAPANVAFHANQLGLHGVVCSRVGADLLGDELLEHLDSHRLDNGCIQRDSLHPTGTVDVHGPRPDQPAYTIRENVAWDYCECDESWRRAFTHAAAVCFGTLAQRSPVARTAIREGLDSAEQALCVYDLNLRPPFYEREWIIASLERCDIVKMSAGEARVLAPLLKPGDDEAGMIRRLIDRFGIDLVCVTRGRAGCLLATAGGSVEATGKPAEVVDAVGAGDAFTAALTYGRLNGWPIEATAELANEIGALVASREGAMPALHEQFAESIERHAP